jgi:hypothetical protein
MLYILPKLEIEEYRKESARKGVRITPTSHYWGPYSRIEDYGLKENIRP